MDPIFHRPDELANYLGFLMHSRRAQSSVTLLQYFGFSEDPFGVSPNARYLYPSQTHQEALASLESGFYNNRGFIAMIAPPGMGKTTLLYRFLEDTQDTARSVFLFDIDADCEPRDFVGYILREFGITPAQSSSEMHRQLADALITETQAGRKCVVVIDEAQSLSDAVLERVRLLTNFETSQGKLLQIILSGQPQLTDKLMQASLVQLRQRVSAICRLEPLSAEETVAYIDYRLKQADYDGDPPFTEDALKLIAEAGNGTPRTINNLCYNALTLCCALKSKQVDGSMVAKVIANLQLVPESSEAIASAGSVEPKESSLRERWKGAGRLFTRLGTATAGYVMLWVPATVLLLVLSVLGVLRPTELRVPQFRKTGDDHSLTPKVAPASVPTQAAATIPRAVATKPTANRKPFQRGYAAGHLVSARPSEGVHVGVTPQMSAAAKSSATGQGAHSVTTQQGSAPSSESGSPAGAPTDVAAAPAAVPLNLRPVLPAAGPLMVQIAATSHAEEVNVLVSALRMHGYTVTARSDPADNLIHVRIGPFYSRDDADRWRVKLLADGYNAIIQP